MAALCVGLTLAQHQSLHAAVWSKRVLWLGHGRCLSSAAYILCRAQHRMPKGVSGSNQAGVEADQHKGATPGEFKVGGVVGT